MVTVPRWAFLLVTLTPALGVFALATRAIGVWHPVWILIVLFLALIYPHLLRRMFGG